MSDSIEKQLAQIEAVERKKRDMLKSLISEAMSKRGSFLAIRSEMGEILLDGKSRKIPYFSARHSLDWVGQHINMGSEMPFMQSQIDDSGRLTITASNAEEIRQRAPDYTRQVELSAYLAHDKRRKFGTILAVISPPWIDDPDSDNWDEERKAKTDAIEFDCLDENGHLCLFNSDNVRTYALDGQHRVMGIRGLQDLAYKGQLEVRKREGTPTGTIYKKETFMEEFEIEVGELEKILDESLCVEYIPAVMKGETRQEATRRVRSVFVAINKYARKPDKGESILLDEADGYAIISRRAGVTHPLFKSEEGGDRINWKNTSLPKRTKWYTTLQHLREMAFEFLSQDGDRAVRWSPKFKNQVPVRPSEEDLEQALEDFTTLLDTLEQLPVFVGLESGDELNEIRMFPHEIENGQGHLLLRPIGQTITAKAVAQLMSEGWALETLAEKLKILDQNSEFCSHIPESIFFGVTYDPKGQKMITRTGNQSLAVDCLVYKIKGAESKERKELLKNIVEARRIDEDKWINFDGDTKVIDGSEQLPAPIK